MSLLGSALRFAGKCLAGSLLGNAGREIGTATGKRIGRAICPGYDTPPPGEDDEDTDDEFEDDTDDDEEPGEEPGEDDDVSRGTR